MQWKRFHLTFSRLWRSTSTDIEHGPWEQWDGLVFDLYHSEVGRDALLCSVLAPEWGRELHIHTPKTEETIVGHRGLHFHPTYHTVFQPSSLTQQLLSLVGLQPNRGLIQDLNSFLTFPTYTQSREISRTIPYVLFIYLASPIISIQPFFFYQMLAAHKNIIKMTFW